MMVTGIRARLVTGEALGQGTGRADQASRRYSGQQFSAGWQVFIGFVAALISINLAFINLLPIPGLDGGHLAFYAAEAVRRKPLNARSQEWAFRTGMALVLALMLFVTLNDLANLPLFKWLGRWRTGSKGISGTADSLIAQGSIGHRAALNTLRPWQDSAPVELVVANGRTTGRSRYR